MPDRPITAGERFADVGLVQPARRRRPEPVADARLPAHRLGARRLDVEWDATLEYGFGTPAGPVIQGGLVTAILDSAMGGACWTTSTATSCS